MSYIISQVLFWLVPISAVVFFVVSLCMYLSAKRKNKREAGSVPENVLKARKITLIVSSVVFGLLLAAACGYGTFFTYRNSFVEYEYAFTNGELDIDKITAKSTKLERINVNF